MAGSGQEKNSQGRRYRVGETELAEGAEEFARGATGENGKPPARCFDAARSTRHRLAGTLSAVA